MLLELTAKYENGTLDILDFYKLKRTVTKKS